MYNHTLYLFCTLNWSLKSCSINSWFSSIQLLGEELGEVLFTCSFFSHSNADFLKQPFADSCWMFPIHSQCIIHNSQKWEFFWEQEVFWLLLGPDQQQLSLLLWERHQWRNPALDLRGAAGVLCNASASLFNMHFSSVRALLCNLGRVMSLKVFNPLTKHGNRDVQLVIATRR